MKIPSVTKFRVWDQAFPFPFKCGEWEMDYPDWNGVYEEIKSILIQNHNSWDAEFVDDLYYIIARDNECETISDMLLEFPEKLRFLLFNCINSKESNCKWQLVKKICNSDDWTEDIENTIYKIYFDKDYYVQRICLMELAKKNSKFTMELAKYSWETFDEYQRICVLWALFYIKSEHLQTYLDVALESKSEFLEKNAKEISSKMEAT